jgi:polyisoprenyl-phosphate glycosyltransferase
LEISVVIPVYGCADCLVELHTRLTSVLHGMGVEYELIFVDDRGPDDSWPILERLATDDPHVRAFRLSRNFGQHQAITAGLAQARGRWTVVMDCDLEDPPTEIPRLYAEATNGARIVYARRIGRPHSVPRRLASAAYFRLLNKLLGTTIDPTYSNLSMIAEPVRDAVLAVRDKDRHYLMILQWLGFESRAIDFRQDKRFAGQSSYTLSTLLRFAFDGLFFQTTLLLRWIVYFGFAIASSGGALAVFFIVRHFTGRSYPGWTSLAVLLLLLSGFIIVSTGLTGLYVGKIFVQVKDRPLYVIEESAAQEVVDVRTESRVAGADVVQVP